VHAHDWLAIRLSGSANGKHLFQAIDLVKFNGPDRLIREQGLDLFHDLTWSRIPKAIRVNDFSIININTELTEPAPDNFYLRVIFFSQLGRHPGGHGLLDGSNRAVMYSDFLHGCAPFRKRASHAVQLLWAEGVTNNHGNWRAAKKIAHPTKASHELLGLNLSIRAEAKSAPARMIAKVISIRLVLFIACLQFVELELHIVSTYLLLARLL
jgi:hypothetical protein